MGRKNVKEKIKKVLAFLGKTMYNINCCGMIAVKREVAAYVAGFPWSECQVRKLTASHCTNNKVYHRVETTCESLYDSHGDVYSHRLSY